MPSASSRLASGMDSIVCFPNVSVAGRAASRSSWSVWSEAVTQTTGLIKQLFCPAFRGSQNSFPCPRSKWIVLMIHLISAHDRVGSWARVG
jgi:hypothetical protein